MALPERWTKILNDLQAQGRYRTLTPPVGIDFSSNDYLGFGNLSLPGVQGLAHSGLASRLLRGQHPLWEEAERLLADWHGAEAALVFTSGYVANEGLLATVIGPGDVAFSDQLNHASIIDGLRLSKSARHIFRHNDLNHLEELLKSAQANRAVDQEWFIVTESLFGMEGDEAPLAEIADLAEKYPAHLIVDEAHATGCFAPHGSGLVDSLELRDRVLATVHTGGKALGVPGAYVVGSKLLRELLINRCRHFLFTTALPAQVARWWCDMISRVARDFSARTRLRLNAATFREALARNGIAGLGRQYIVPIVIGADAEAVELAAKIQAAGFDVRAIRPPTVPEGQARLRVSIHADHERQAILDLAEALAKL